MRIADLVSNNPYQIVFRASFFRALVSDAEFKVTFFRQGAEISTATIQAGYAQKFDSPFDSITLLSTTNQTIQFVLLTEGEAFYDRMAGVVSIQNPVAVSGAFVQTQATVTNASAQLLAAKAARRYLLVQNNDAVGDVFVTLDGTAATTAKGVKLSAGGGALELATFAPTGAISAIGSVASNANVVVVEA